jgi:hypothetical protein
MTEPQPVSSKGVLRCCRHSISEAQQCWSVRSLISGSVAQFFHYMTRGRIYYLNTVDTRAFGTHRTPSSFRDQQGSGTRGRICLAISARACPNDFLAQAPLLIPDLRSRAISVSWTVMIHLDQLSSLGFSRAKGKGKQASQSPDNTSPNDLDLIHVRKLWHDTFAHLKFLSGFVYLCSLMIISAAFSAIP